MRQGAGKRFLVYKQVLLYIKGDCIRPHLNLEGRVKVGAHDVADGQNEDLHASSTTSAEIDHGEPHRQTWDKRGLSYTHLIDQGSRWTYAILGRGPQYAEFKQL